MSTICDKFLNAKEAEVEVMSKWLDNTSALCPKCGKQTILIGTSHTGQLTDHLYSLEEYHKNYYTLCRSCGWYLCELDSYVDDDYEDIHESPPPDRKFDEKDCEWRQP